MQAQLKMNSGQIGRKEGKKEFKKALKNLEKSLANLKMEPHGSMGAQMYAAAQDGLSQLSMYVKQL